MFLQDQGRNRSCKGRYPSALGGSLYPWVSTGPQAVTPTLCPSQGTCCLLHLQRAVLVLAGADGHVIGQVREMIFLRIISQTVSTCSFMTSIFGVLAEVHLPWRCLQFSPQYFSFCMTQELAKVFSCPRNQDWEQNATGTRQDELQPCAHDKGRRKAFHQIFPN